MKSEYVKNLMALLKAKRIQDENAFDAAIQAASGNLSTAADKLLVSRMVFAWKVIFYSKQNVNPPRSGNPYAPDDNWYLAVHNARKNAIPWPDHPDNDVQNFLNDAFGA